MSLTDHLPPSATDADAVIPDTIRLFERLQITSLAIGWAAATLAYRTTLHAKIGPVLFAALLVAMSTAMIVLAFRIARRKSARSSWLLIGLAAFCAAPWLARLRLSDGADLLGVLVLAQGVLQAAALALLVQPAARDWFASRHDDVR